MGKSGRGLLHRSFAVLNEIGPRLLNRKFTTSPNEELLDTKDNIEYLTSALEALGIRFWVGEFTFATPLLHMLVSALRLWSV